MSPRLPRPLQELAYEREAQAYLEYLRKHRPEHFMEGIGQARQREITLESLAVVRASRPDFRVFNELLVQWPRPRQKKPGQVVPDNMVVLSQQPLRASTSFNVPLEPAGPFWVFEYVSKGNPRKDYEDSFQKYEKELKVPYYLLFYPDTQDLTLYRHNKRKYVSVLPNDNGRYAIPEVELEVAVLDGWVRYWYQGRLLPLPAELQGQLDETRQRLQETQQHLSETQQHLSETQQHLHDARQQAEEAARRAEEEKSRADELQERLKAMESELARLRDRPEE
jgi:Uma2 family endonuclease